MRQSYELQLDSVGWRDCRLQPQRGESRVYRRGGNRGGNRKGVGKTIQITNYQILEHGIQVINEH